MGLSNAERQARWRERNQVTLTEGAEEIAAKLTAMDGPKLRKVAALMAEHLERHPCEKCGGTGVYGIKSYKCGAKTACATTPGFPCPDCRPADYAVVSGVTLRNEGRFVEALDAALKVMDYWSAGDT